MTLDELRDRLAAQLPGSLIPRDTVLEWVEELTGEDDEPRLRAEGLADLTVEEVADELGRSESTVRGWLREELIPGAYKLRGREWRVPVRGLREFLEVEAHAGPRTLGPSEPRARDSSDLGAWREHRSNGSDGG